MVGLLSPTYWWVSDGVTHFIKYTNGDSIICITAAVVMRLLVQKRELLWCVVKKEDFSQITLRNEFMLFFNNATGYTIGAQLGYRYEAGKIDFGFQLQANYVRLFLTHGNEERHYNFNIVCLPVMLYAGYRF